MKRCAIYLLIVCVLLVMGIWFIRSHKSVPVVQQAGMRAGVQPLR